MDILGFKKEENFSYYKLLYKGAREWIDKTNHCPYMCGPGGRIPRDRRGDKIMREIYIIRNKFNMTIRSLHLQTGAKKDFLDNRLYHLLQNKHSG